MIVIMARVTVGRNHNLEAVSPKLLGKSHTDIVCGIRIHLISLEGLVAVVTGSAVFFTVPVLHLHELLCRIFFA